jgi:AraC family transcriptional regulator
VEPKLPCGHFYGQVLQSRSVAGLTLTETAYRPHTRLPRHSHENAYFCLVRRGTYTEVYGNRTRTCVPMNLVIHPPGEVHSEQFHDTEGRSFNIEVTPPLLERVREFSGILDQPAEFQGGPLASLAVRMYTEFQTTDEVSPLTLQGLTLELIAEASRRANRQTGERAPRWLGRVRDVLHDRFMDNLSLAELGETAGVHPVHLATVFRRQFQCTVGQYIRRLRVEYACRRIAASDASLAEIALAAGFADQSHFCAIFKRLTGMTPREYRQSLLTG